MMERSPSFLLVLGLGLLAATVNLIGFSSALNLSYLLFVLLALGGAFGFRWLFRNRDPRLGHLLLAVLAALAVYLSFPNIFVDDTGFVVRYMNMARQGCFYCYNLSDGPVFGISSFVYGVLTCAMAMLLPFSNEAIIIGLNAVALVGLFYLLLRILRMYLKDEFLVISGAALAVMSSTRFLFSSTAGLETNVHLAIVFAAILFFLRDRHKWMWLFFGSAVVSKLDVVPLVVLLSLIHLFEHRAQYFGAEWLRPWRVAVLFAGIPLLLFVAVSFILFDGPLPQSAYAKLYHHSHPSEHWFPFLELMMDKGARRSMFFFSFGIALIHAVVALKRGVFRLREFALLLGFAATLVLYYIYNPVERMTWYYAMPELLLYMQLVVSMGALARSASQTERLRLAVHSLLFAALSIAAVPLTLGEKDWMDRYKATVESERSEIGRFIAQLPTGDTLVSAHGHFGAYFDGYVLDLSGLNSKLATDFKRNTDSILGTFRPRYFIHHASAGNANDAHTNGYHPVKEWTAIEEYGYPKWVLYERE
jgi:hypothetical protein